MIGSLLRNASNLLAGAVLLAVPAYAVCSLLPGTHASAQVLAEGDDPIRNGLRIVDEPVAPNRQPGVIGGEPDVLILTDWMFTTKGQPSPYG